MHAAARVEDRIHALDGMRGVAALSVVAFHYLARWAEPIHPETLYPHGNALAWFPPLAAFGQFGVLLFFMISGFVILMTLERSPGLLVFAERRIARLWPMMIVCATLSAIVINASDIAGFYGIPRLEVTTLEHLSSIVFLPPQHVSRLLGGGEAQWVEGVYWTLWVEVRFYAVAATAFLLAPAGTFMRVWAGVQAASAVVAAGLVPAPRIVELFLQPDYLPWFSLGLCGYMLHTGRAGPAVMATALFATGALLQMRVVHIEGGLPAPADGALRAVLLYLAIWGAFGLFLARSRLLRWVEARWLVAVGLASYPLYLFHERIGMVGMMWVSETGTHPVLGLMLMTAGVVAVALLLHRLVEVPARRAVSRRLRPIALRGEARYGWLRFGAAAPARASGARGGGA